MRRFTAAWLLACLPCIVLQLPAASAADNESLQPLSAAERALLNPGRSMLELGRNVANTACVVCHGADGVSTAPGIPNLAGQRAVYLYRILQEYQGRERRNDAMNNATGFLNREALQAVSAWFSSLSAPWPTVTEEQAAVAAEIRQGDPFADLHETVRKCSKCHGEDGNSSAAGMPNLSAQGPEYFVSAMQGYASGKRGNRLMQKFARGLDDDTLDRIGVYYAVQEPARTSNTGDGDAEAGRTLSERCASCHGNDGNASSPDMPTLAGQDPHYFIKAVRAYKDGKRPHEQMLNAVEPLGEEDVSNLAAFYAQQGPVRRNVRRPFTTAEWIERCERCHGVDGNSTDPRFPMLAGQDATYLANAMRAYSDVSRSNSAMHAMADPLSEADIRRIVAHYATRKPKSVVYISLPCDEAPEK